MNNSCKKEICETIYQNCFEQLKPQILNDEMSNLSDLSRQREILRQNLRLPFGDHIGDKVSFCSKAKKKKQFFEQFI